MSRDTYRRRLSLSDSHMREFLGNADECWSPQLGKKKQRASTQASHHMNLGFSLIQKDDPRPTLLVSVVQRVMIILLRLLLSHK